MQERRLNIILPLKNNPGSSVLAHPVNIRGLVFFGIREEFFQVGRDPPPVTG